MNMLQGDHITVRYGDYTAVDDLSFRLEAGQWLMLAGPNGAGKTTLIEAIVQSVPYTGSILWEGQDICTLKPAKLAQRIGVLSQKRRRVLARENGPQDVHLEGDVFGIGFFNEEIEHRLAVAGGKEFVAVIVIVEA